MMYLLILYNIFRLPTLFISECVLIYLKPEKGDAIIKWVSDTFASASFCTYEQIGPNDSFGTVMTQNLEVRYTTYMYV
jgi:O-methyltransferase involved in polyketide biosynthesis